MTWLEFQKAFEEILYLHGIGDVTDEEFFNLYCESIKQLGGKLPYKEPDVTTPPQAD